MKIEVKSSTMIRPMAETPSTTLWLSNIDAVMPTNYHTLTVYFYRFTGAANFFEAVALKAALSRALVEHYPVAGRLKRDDKGRIEINCNGEGVLLVEAECDGAIDDLGGDFAPRAELRLIPTVDYSLGISTYPLSLVQVTRFKCGGVCLGIANEHHVADGVAAINFINAWSDIARGVKITVSPFVDRTLLRAGVPPKPEFTHIEFHPPPAIKTLENIISQQPEMVFSVFKLTRDHLDAIKTNCKQQEEEDGGVNEVITYSTYEALAAHLWRCVNRARLLPENQKSKLYLVMDMRSRLRPPLPRGYFGNAISSATPIASCGELETNPLRFAARKIRDSIAQMGNSDYLRSGIDYLELQNDDLESNARGASPFKSPNLGIISWVKMPMYEADFGWGKPIYVGVGEAPSEGKTIVMSSGVDDGSLMYAISLPKDQMKLFEKFLYEF